ncbi:MAG: hypothetical protein ABEJ81_02460 [Haloferacaceae archaeon]
MPDHHADSAGSEASRGDSTHPGTGTVEAYEADGSVVIYDAEQPLAWIEASTSVALADAR